MAVGEEWIEVRATHRTALDSLPLPFGRPPATAVRHEAGLSVVLDGGDKRVRRLPTLYLGKGPLFAERELAPVQERLLHVASAIVDARRRPTYLLHPCEVRGRRGLYGGDFYNRSSYRRRLARLGTTFTADPYTRFNSEEGSFQCEDWGDFTAEFIVLSVSGAEPKQVVQVRGARLFALLTPVRLGALAAAELAHLARALSSVKGVGSSDPESLVEFLSSPER
jgi:hypothetical protein